MREIKDCCMDLLSVAMPRVAEEMERELLEDLFFAATSGDYDSIAESLAKKFWGEVGEMGEASVKSFRELFAVLIERCPKLAEPLQFALDERNPFRDLLSRDDMQKGAK